MNRDSFLLVYGMDSEKWSLRYGIDPEIIPCSECGEDFVTSIPFAIGELRGLISKACVCGNDDTPYCLVRDPKKGDLFRDVEVADSKIGDFPKRPDEEPRLLRLLGSVDG